MKDLEWIKKGYFAHRGLHNDDIQENTMAAFNHAIENGFHIELDIKLTLDEKIVVFHDQTLNRLCGIDKKVEECTYDELKVLKIRDTDQGIPLLIEVLDSLPKTTELLIELKPSKRPRLFTRKFLELMKNYKHKYCIHSFDPRIVYEFRKQDPSIIRGQISSTFPDKKKLNYKLMKHLCFNIFTKPDFVNYRFEDLPRKKLDRLYKKGMMILSYTARSEEDLRFVRERYDNAVFEGFIPKK